MGARSAKADSGMIGELMSGMMPGWRVYQLPEFVSIERKPPRVMRPCAAASTGVLDLIKP